MGKSRKMSRTGLGNTENTCAIEISERFRHSVTGFEMAEVDLLISEASGNEPDEADVIPEIDRSTSAVSRPGDCWQIGDYFLLCGDALRPETDCP